jgi:hypothetical protein
MKLTIRNEGPAPVKVAEGFSPKAIMTGPVIMPGAEKTLEFEADSVSILEQTANGPHDPHYGA